MKGYEHILPADDKFQFIVEHPDAYGPKSSYDRMVDYFTSIARSDKLSQKDRFNVKLGLMYAARHRSNKPGLQFLIELDEMISLSPADPSLSYKIEYLRGSIHTLKLREYCKAVEILEPIYSKLRPTNLHFLYGLVTKSLGSTYMLLGRVELADKVLQEAISTFHRYGHELLYGNSLNDYAVLKKMTCHYMDAETLLKKSLRVANKVDALLHQLNSYTNLTIISLRTGNGPINIYFRKSEELRDLIIGDNSEEHNSTDASAALACDLNYERYLITSREFDIALERLKRLQKRLENKSTLSRHQALMHLYFGELLTEKCRYDEADTHLEMAMKKVGHELAKSDVMPPILRRQAYLCLCVGNIRRAKQNIKNCISLSKQIADKYELGASIRILGEIYIGSGDYRRATVCFVNSIKILGNIHATYELMLSCIAYGTFLIDQNEPGAETYLMEARQLCKKLEIDYFMALIDVELARLATANDSFTDARVYLADAERIYDVLQTCDQKRLKPLIDRTNKGLDGRILKKSMTAAEEMKTICRVYEEARFPMDDIKPDLAYQVAQTVGAESLFLVRRYGRGYSVSLTYNISINHAKEVVRRLDRDSKRPILGIEKNPMVFTLHTGNTLICVPSQSESGYVLCTQIPGTQILSPRQLERLFASAEALERLAESDKDDRPVTVADEFLVTENNSRVTHPRGSFKKILTIDSDMIKIARLAERASLTDATILLEGETGVGKELFARAIHANSPRSERPFVAINAGGMPVNLLESQLFGHVKGAFTDAVADRVGLIEHARDGTVFFDEVGEMGPELQVKLLRILESGEYRRLGENQVRIANVRVISATNRDLLDEVNRGAFRRDLYYRLGTVKLQIPALRYRQRDIELLIRHFLKQSGVRSNQPTRHFEIDVKAMEAMELYDWPGNVRELQNEIMRIISLIGEIDVIRFGMLSQPVKDYIKSKNRREGLLERSVERYERRLILEALNENDWNRVRTAEKLGLPRTTLIAKMRRLNVSAKQV